MNKITCACSLLMLICLGSLGQTEQLEGLKLNTIQKGDFTVYFGWNRGSFSNSNIHFKGNDYDFIINEATASDRQTPFSVEKYFKLNSITIPQTNMGATYQLTEKVRLSFNVDHMKYVLDQNQVASVTGQIDSHYGAMGGAYNNTPTVISEELVRFEHTDGLNYLNFGYTRTHQLFSVGKYFGLQLNYGGALGVLLPKTNSTLLKKERYDDFHLSGYGSSANVEAQLNITKWFFFGTNLKGGFINMPNIRTSQDKSDKASQHFWFKQWNFLFGFRFNLEKS